MWKWSGWRVTHLTRTHNPFPATPWVHWLIWPSGFGGWEGGIMLSKSFRAVSFVTMHSWCYEYGKKRMILKSEYNSGSRHGEVCAVLDECNKHSRLLLLGWWQSINQKQHASSSPKWFWCISEKLQLIKVTFLEWFSLLESEYLARVPLYRISANHSRASIRSRSCPVLLYNSSVNK